MIDPYLVPEAAKECPDIDVCELGMGELPPYPSVNCRSHYFTKEIDVEECDTFEKLAKKIRVERVKLLWDIKKIIEDNAVHMPPFPEKVFFYRLEFMMASPLKKALVYDLEYHGE